MKDGYCWCGAWSGIWAQCNEHFVRTERAWLYRQAAAPRLRSLPFLFGEAWDCVLALVGVR
jgi:hypothetical protein